MRFFLFLSALSMAIWVSSAQAQQATPQQNPPQPAQPPKPAAAKPKPKPAVAAKKTTPAVTTPKANLIEKVNDWSVFVYEGADGRVCFAAAAPSDMQPKTAKRTPVIFYVTTWQKGGVRNEVSVKLGYSAKANATAVVAIGSQNFALTADDDKAYAKDPAEERKLLAAMANGGAMIVKATSAKGTATTDQYSLEGIAGAVRKLQEACP
jgi:hypothetical protein